MSKVKILLYCTKGKPYLYNVGVENWWYNEGCYEPFDYREGFRVFDKLQKINRYKQGDCDVQIGDLLNGKIVAECECDKVEEVVYNGWWNSYADNDSIGGNYFDNDLACLSVDELKNYLGYDKKGYAIHLSNVKVFNKPKELGEYSKRLPNGDFQVLGNAPQNMMNVCKIKYLIEDYVLISVQPQHLVNILNGRKTIEVRKSILNALKELM